MNYYFKSKSSDQIAIRKLEPNDAIKVLDYLCIVGGETDFLLFDQRGIGLNLEQERTFLEKMSYEKTSLLVGCFNGEEIVAVANLSVQERPKINHKASIGISVKRMFWDQGIGTEIMKYFIDYSVQNKQINILNLEVRTDNERAIKLYKKLGFIIVGTIPKAIKINGNFYDHYMMIREV